MLDRRQSGVFAGEQQHLCSAQGCVAGRFDPFAGRFDEADPVGALDLHIIAECASQMNGLKVACAGADAVEQQPDSRGDGRPAATASTRPLPQMPRGSTSPITVERSE